ncbi:type I polyketide synthase [Xenorhabdus cabanillasii]|uniref:Polyketide synthase type I n=1 Tax=Xenorhabdus cabanillasii JM26 TaxID=1427517 RepID=W1J808_9GAMM|nr:type I polyketide synthase [Xenorhabdus cabanillasii]PHM77390.1 polyketide synthase family protein [Xenorhabdus cabanillasii JM26]CDL85986.1 putative Polyketide synthase type I [Xenorhabdus cabanillasii JM26]
MNNTDVNKVQVDHSQMAPSMESMHGFEIAIIGMAGQFAGTNDIEQFWQNIAAGVESIRPLSDAELDAEGVSMEARSRADFIRNASVLDHPEDFDAEFFGYSPREAQAIDPQQRLFLETSWLALENAGYTPEKFPGVIGVYASSSGSSYLLHYLLNYPTVMRRFLSDMLLFGNNNDLLSTRVSYKFNLRGPSFTIGSACSSSMVALHYACQSLLAGECDIALGGGVHIGFPSHSGYHFDGSGILSHDGHCRTFDAEASGTLGGDGVGVLVLKQLQDALDSGDHIYAIIKGSAVNNDGAEKIGFTAPSVAGQTAVLQRALLAADVPAESISYIEAHGTATHLGDPMEMKALLNAYDPQAVRIQERLSQEQLSQEQLSQEQLAGEPLTGRIRCAVASVKANLGHVDSAAGVTGVMKVAQMLTHRYLPPAVNFTRLNPEINLTGSRFYIPTEGEEWQSQSVRRAGVSSFGIGGTNAHMILQEAPSVPSSGPAHSQQLLCFSAKTPAALWANMLKFRQWLEKSPQLPLADIAYTLHIGRHEMDYRHSLVCHDHKSAITALDNYLSQTAQENTVRTVSSSVVFMFSGQGAQYSGMMKGYYEQEPQFKTTVDKCAVILLPLLGRDIRTLIFDSTKRDETSALYQTRYTQPALFVVEYALSQLLMEWGLRPTACIGHSIGEYVAACLAGVFTLEDALKIVVRRAGLMNQMPVGKMLAVGLDAKTLQGYLSEGVTLSAYNAPELCVVSGETDAILALEARLAEETENSIEVKALHTSHAFHSAMMDGCLEPFRQSFDGISLSAPRLPFISCVTGTWITAEQATSPDYWVRQLREPISFSQGIACLLSQQTVSAKVQSQKASSPKTPVLLEVGPGSTLAGLAKIQSTGISAYQRVLSSTRGIKQDIQDRQHLLNILGQLWQQGISVDWAAFYRQQKRHRLPLPGYVFQHQRYSLDTLVGDDSYRNHPHSSQSVPDNGRLPLEQWSHQVRWKQMTVPMLDHVGLNGQVFLIFMDRAGIGKRLTTALTQLGGEVWRVIQGKHFHADTTSRQVTINPQHSEDYQALADLLKQQKVRVNNIIHAWSITRSPSIALQTAFTNYESLLHIARQFAVDSVSPDNFSTDGMETKNGLLADILKINILSNRLHAITEHDCNDPAKALLIGPCRVIPKEFEQVQCKSIDIALPATRWSLPLLNPVPSNVIMSTLLAEILGQPAEQNAERQNEQNNIVALRGRHRYVPLIETATLPVASPSLFRQRGNYLITGGFGGIGATIAMHLASRYQPHLIFISRSELPPQNEWSDWLENHDADNKRSRHIRLLQQLQQMGASVSVIAADLADAARVGKALTDVVLQHGQIHGIFHCAGIADGGLIQNRRFEDSLQVFQSKVVGTQVLDNWFKRQPLDFFVLCSSLASTVGSMGQVAYCAANAFEDAYALSRHQQHCSGRKYSGKKNRTRYLAIGWDSWCEVGMAVDSLRQWYQDDEEQESIKHGILPEEGCQLLESLLAHSDSVYAISTRGLPLPDIDQGSEENTAAGQDPNVVMTSSWQSEGASIQKSSTQKTDEQKLYPRPVLNVDYQPPRNQTEEIIADIWQEKMGIGPLGVFDDFFELNGHSLMAVQIIAKIKQRLQVTFPVGFIYEHSTIEQLAEQVNLRSRQKTENLADNPEGRK